jgi:hypothetical protein
MRDNKRREELKKKTRRRRNQETKKSTNLRIYRTKGPFWGYIIRGYHEKSDEKRKDEKKKKKATIGSIKVAGKTN